MSAPVCRWRTIDPSFGYARFIRPSPGGNLPFSGHRYIVSVRDTPTDRSGLLRARTGLVLVVAIVLASLIAVTVAVVAGSGKSGPHAVALPAKSRPTTTTTRATSSTTTTQDSSTTVTTAPAPSTQPVTGAVVTPVPSPRPVTVAGGSGTTPSSVSSTSQTSGAVSYASTAPNPPSVDIPAEPGLAIACRSSDLNACIGATVLAIDNARAQEGVTNIVLPTDFADLTASEQLFVIIDCERVDRGLTPISGILSSLDQLATSGAETDEDPSLPAGGIPDANVLAWGGNWASTQSPLQAVYGWMYDDGVGSDNVGCTETNQSGCWTHRDNLLGFQNDINQFAGTLSFGAASVPGGGGNVSVTTFTTWSPDAPSDYYYTWDDALANGAS